MAWKSWCRLCACTDNSNNNIFIKDENFYSLAETIQQYLSITICDVDEAPQKICNTCQNSISELVVFCIKSTKVQEMYSELQFNEKFEMLTNYEELREKYGLSVSVDGGNNVINYKNEENDAKDKQQTNQKKGYKRNLNTVDRVDENVTSSEEKFDIINQNDENYDYDFDENISKVLDNENFEINVEIKEEHLVEIANNNEQLQKKIKPNKKLLSKDYKIFCEVCNKGFGNQGGYTTHLKLVHKIVKQPKIYPCKTCEKVYDKFHQLKVHENTHLPIDQRKLYPCPHCDKKFSVATSISGHIRTVHMKEKYFVCEECGKAFATSGRLAGHKFVHTDEKPFQCLKCSKCFKCSESLKHHVDTHDETKYICPICGTQLNTKRILRRHMIIHSDEKKYKCNFCDKDFKRTKDFKSHLIIHTGIKPYQCPFCDQTFANGANCRKHKKTTHPKELAEAEEAGTIHITNNIPSMQLLRAVNEEAILNNKKSRLK